MNAAFTANPDFADDVSALFNYLTGYSELPVWKKLIVAPSRLQDFMIEKAHESFITLYGIESPGLTSCLAIGDYVARMAA